MAAGLTWERFKRSATTLLSRLVNRIRLSGLPGHRRQIARAGRVLSKLNGAHPAQVIAYLRKVHSAVAEEIVLTLWERTGSFVLRNRRYTGDGGIDGRVYIQGTGWAAIQTKRYSSAINPAHVVEFAALVRRDGYAAGVFVHTGRTGPMSRRAIHGTPIFFLSGEQLCACVAGHSPVDLLRVADRGRGPQGMQRMPRTSESSRLAASASRRMPG